MPANNETQQIIDYTELSVKMDFFSRDLEKGNDIIKELLVSQNTTNALLAAQRETLTNLKQSFNDQININEAALNNTATSIRKEIIVNNDLQSNKMKVFIFSGLIGFAITISMPFIIEFIKNI